MNKFAAIVLLAFVAVAAAQDFEQELEGESAVGAIPTDSEEIADLTGKNKVFGDFCRASRDYVISDLRTLTSGFASGLFAGFFKTIEEVTVQRLDNVKNAANRLGEQIRNPDAPIEGDDDVAKVQHEIQDGQQKSFFNAAATLKAFATTFASGTSVAAKAIADKLNALKAMYGLQTAIQAVGEVCDKASKYEQEIIQKFNEAKSEIVASDSSFAPVKLDQVECITSRRILRIEGLCKFARVAQGPLMRIMTYSQ